MRVNLKTVSILKRYELTLNQYFVLFSLYFSKYKWALEFVEEFDFLKEMSYIEQKDDDKKGPKAVITPKGRDLVGKCLATVVQQSSADIEKEFRKWWQTFPMYSDHSHFSRTRKLKINRVDAFRRYVEALQEGINPEDLLFALKKDINERISNSTQYKNELATMPSPAKWLYQKEYETYLKKEDTQDNVDRSSEYGKQLF